MMDMGNDSDWEDEVQDGLRQLPSGEEGFLQSHAGGEAVLQAVMDGITLSYVHPFFPFFYTLILPYRKRVDSRTRKDRIQKRVKAWQLQIPALTEQYLKWKATGRPCNDPSEIEKEASWEIETISFSGMYNYYLSSVTCLTWTIRSQQSRIPPHVPNLLPE